MTTEKELRDDIDRSTRALDRLQKKLDEVSHERDELAFQLGQEVANTQAQAAAVAILSSRLVTAGHNFQRQSHLDGCEGCRDLVAALASARVKVTTEPL
jgi:hypothetical protein